MSGRKSAASNEANRLGLDYRVVPPRKVEVPIVDAHVHLHAASHVPAFFEAAELYGIRRVRSMTPLAQVEGVRAAAGERVEFIAIPRWREFGVSEEFRRQWLADLEAFRAAGARLCKFWMAPPMRGEHGLTLDHEYVRPVIDRAAELGFEFMVHVGDPTVWWQRADKYADTAKFGTKADQYPQLRWFLEYVRPRRVLAAHLGGSIEGPAFLQELLDQHTNLLLDSSATKWVVRETAPQPERVREFVIRNAGRVLFGSDLVTADSHDFEHYASRYWVHLKLWESAYRGESPIADPDGPQPPQLVGLDLPEAVLRKMYCGNASRL